MKARVRTSVYVRASVDVRTRVRASEYVRARITSSVECVNGRARITSSVNVLMEGRGRGQVYMGGRG